MFRVAKVDPLRVEIIAPAALFGSIRNGMFAHVTPDVPSGPPIEAKVVLVDKLIDAASNTFRVRAELPNPDGAIPSGLRCRAEVAEVAAKAQAPSAPVGSPQETNQTQAAVKPGTNVSGNAK